MSAIPACATGEPPRVEAMAGTLAGKVSGATKILCGEPLARRTTLRVGGPADIFVEPDSELDLAVVVRFCREQAVPLFVLGRGSNLLVKDGGFRGVVVCLSRPAFCGVEIGGGRVRCGAGAKLKEVAVAARRGGLSGLEFLEGIPGSVGGALRMNAGAMGGAIFDLVETIRVMDFFGDVRECAPSEFEVRYRQCVSLREMLALAAVLRGQAADPGQVQRRMNEFSQKRWASQPAAPSAGCVFKNPEALPAGKLVDELGLKGSRVGGAVVSAEHGNFIVNDGTATARDVLELIELIRRRARAERGIELETEVEILGE